MEVTFSELRQKEVINLVDGKHLGRVCNVTLSFPDGRVLGLTATGSKGFKFSKQNVYIPLKCVTKIGEDAILVNYGGGKPEEKPPQKRQNCPEPPPCPPAQSRRSFDEYE